VNQILGEMRQTAHLASNTEPTEGVDGTVDWSRQIASLPIAWIYENVKDGIESSLAAISEYIRNPQ
jgi:hypothetical protein